MEAKIDETCEVTSSKLLKNHEFLVVMIGGKFGDQTVRESLCGISGNYLWDCHVLAILGFCWSFLSSFGK